MAPLPLLLLRQRRPLVLEVAALVEGVALRVVLALPKWKRGRVTVVVPALTAGFAFLFSKSWVFLWSRCPWPFALGFVPGGGDDEG